MDWQHRRVLITGHTGFKGAWLALWLQKLGAEVTGLALAPPSRPNLYAGAHIGTGMHSIIGDIRDAATVADAMEQARPEVVIHMAAQSLVRPSYIDPLGTYATNVMGTAHVMNAVRGCPSVRAVVIVTSDKCYENHEWPWPYRETDTLGGYDPYSNSKACAELVTDSFRSAFFHPERFHEHGVAIASARAGNVIGGGDWALDRLVPDGVRAFSAKEPLQLRNPGAVRPWQHVLEPLRGYLLLAEALMEHNIRFTGAWNFGPHAEAVRPVSAVIGALAAKWPGAGWESSPGPHPHEAGTLTLDCSKARAHLNWHPALSFEEAISLTGQWYSRYYAGENMQKLCLEQLEKYTALLAETQTVGRPTF